MASSLDPLVRLLDRLIASDPGLVQLRVASFKVLSLGISLAVLYGLTKLAGQPFTAVLLAVMISVTGSMGPLRHLVTAGLMLAVTGTAVTLGVWLAPDKVAGEVVFVVIIAAATFAQRLGSPASNLGLAGFIIYLVAVSVGFTFAQLPWLIAAVAIGTAVSLSVGLVLRENPSRQISRVGHALDSRLALVLDVVADGLAAPAWTRWHHRRLARRVGQVHDTVLMIGGQLHDLDEHDLPGGIDRNTLVRRLFDVELSVEYLSAAWQRAADGGSGPGHDANPQPETRSRLRDAVVALRTGLRAPDRAGALAKARTIAVDAGAVPAISPRWQSLARSVSSLSHAIANLRAPEPDPASDQAATDGQPEAADEVHANNTALHGTQPDDTVPDQSQTWTADGSPAADRVTGPRLSPNTRQVVQVTVAGALAIVVGQLLSPSRWHWALITAFLIYFGTSTRGQTLTKGWQRVVGTVIGVGIGTLVASLVGGNMAVSLALIFVAIFTGSYLGKMSYAVLSTCVTSMLALLYGLFGEFTIGLLLTRIEETTIGAAIGIAAAFLILPTRTITAARASIRSFLQRLADLVAMAGQQLSGQGHDDLLGAAWVLDQQLAAVRTRIDPPTKAITGLRSSSRASWALNLLDICDHAGRGLARVAAPVGDQAAGHALEHAARRIHDNIGLLVDAIDQRARPSLPPAGDLLADAKHMIATQPVLAAERRRLELTARHLSQIEYAVRQLAQAAAGGGTGE